MRRNFVYTHSSPQPRNKLDQPNKVPDTEAAAAATDDEDGIGPHDVGPTRRQTLQLALLTVEVDPLLPPRLPILHQLVLLAEARMKRVRHPEYS